MTTGAPRRRAAVPPGSGQGKIVTAAGPRPTRPARWSAARRDLRRRVGARGRGVAGARCTAAPGPPTLSTWPSCPANRSLAMSPARSRPWSTCSSCWSARSLALFTKSDETHAATLDPPRPPPHHRVTPPWGEPCHRRRRRRSSNAADGARARDVQRLHAALHRDRQQPVAHRADRGREPVGLVAEHQRHPPRQVRVQQRRPARVAARAGEPAVAQRRAALLGGRRPQHRCPERHPGRRLDHQRVDRRHAAAGEQHAVEPGRRRAAQHHPDVRRVGDAGRARARAAGSLPRSRRNSSTGCIRGATTSASTPWSWRPLPASTFTRCAVARCTGTPRARAAARMARTGSPRASSASTTLSTRRSASSSASSTGLRPYTVMKVSLGERATVASVPRRVPRT